MKPQFGLKKAHNQVQTIRKYRFQLATVDQVTRED